MSANFCHKTGCQVQKSLSSGSHFCADHDVTKSGATGENPRKKPQDFSSENPKKMTSLETGDVALSQRIIQQSGKSAPGASTSGSMSASISVPTLSNLTVKPEFRKTSFQPTSTTGRMIPDVPTPEDEEAGGRETWNKKVDFLLSVIGFAVDLSNVWRFPYLCYKNGGGAFLVPYIIMLAVGGIPLFFMELALGQFHRKGAITCWGRLVPAFKGIGYAVVLIAFYVDFYYNVIIAWALHYFVNSFNSVLPWTTCNNEWNTERCREIQGLPSTSESTTHQTSPSASPLISSSNGRKFLSQFIQNATSLMSSSSSSSSNIKSIKDYMMDHGMSYDPDGVIYYDGATVPLQNQQQPIVDLKSNYTSPADEYFNRGLLELHRADGIEGLGEIKWDVALCLLAVYLICYFSLWKGISTSGKVVWFTALFPYVVLVILLIRGILLPGAGEGIKYYLTPNFSALRDANVWVDAATQVFFSLGPGFGVLLAFASYNRFHNNVYRDALLTSAVNSATSFLAGFVIFSVLGYMAHRNNVEVKDVAAEGPGLVFIVYPEALATFPGAPFFSLMFFLMLLTLGLDSSFGGSEAIITALSDEYPIIKRNREVFVGLLFTLYFLVGLASCCQGGAYVVQLLDRYAASYSILFAVFCESIAVSWIYGLPRFTKDIRSMLGFDIGWWWKFCWIFCAPLFLMVIIVYGLISYEPLTYDSYVYPLWANVLGLLIAASSVSMIPIMAVYQFYVAPGDDWRQKLHFIITPYSESHVTHPNVHKRNNSTQVPLATTTSIVINDTHLESTHV